MISIHMPFLPALLTVIGIGLQCKKEPGTMIYPQGEAQHVQCNLDTALLDAFQWEQGIASFAVLPPKIFHGLQQYESELKSHLADYSKFCGIGRNVGESHYLYSFHEDIAKIFCPSEFMRCHGWKHTGRCVNKLCRRLYPLYEKVSDGIDIMETECIPGDFVVANLEGNEADASIERAHRSLE